jgi:hypothetical protein
LYFDFLHGGARIRDIGGTVFKANWLGFVAGCFRVYIQIRLLMKVVWAWFWYLEQKEGIRF